MNPSEFNDLFERIKQGDEAAFNKLVQTYRDKLVNYAVKLVNGDVDGAEDVVQNTFKYFLPRISSLDQLTLPYLKGQVANQALNYRRWKARRPEVFLESAGGKTAEGEPKPLDPEDSRKPSQASREAVMQSEVIQRAIGKLKPIYAEAITLRYEKNLSFEEAANVAGIKKDAMSKRHHAAIKQLKEHLARDDRNADQGL